MAAADFDGNGVPDLVWQNDSTRQVTVNYYGGAGGAVFQGWNWLHQATDVAGWTVVAAADFDGNGTPDLVWQNDTTGQVTVHYYGQGAQYQGWNSLYSGGPNGFHVKAAVDMDSNGVPDLIWLNDSTRQVTVNYYGRTNGATYLGWDWLNFTGVPGWTLAGANDFDGNGTPDLVWINDTTGQVTVNYYQLLGGKPNYGGNWAYLNSSGNPGWTLIVPGFGRPTTPASTWVIPFGWVSPAETLMFTANTSSANYFEVVIETAGTFNSNHNVVATNACYIVYLASSNVLVLGDDNLDAQYWVNPGGTTPGTQAQVPAVVGQDPNHTNHQCTLDVSRSWVKVTGGQMKLQLALTFQPSWSGAKEMFVDVGDNNGQSLYWSNRGSWTVPTYSQVPVTTDHYDVFRTGANVHETALNIANAGSLSLKGTISLPSTDGCIWGQPLYVPGVTTGGGVHDVLYFATGHANVYAYDANSLAFLWSKSLWQSVSGATGAPPPGMVGGGADPDLVDCGNQSPQNSPIGSESGVVGTPVIDLSSNTMYVVGNLYVNDTQACQPAANPCVKHYMFGIDILSSAVRIVSVPIASFGQISPQFTAPMQLQRGGLLLADYNLVASYASYANHAPYQSWMFDFNRGNLAPLDNWNYAGSESDPSGTLCGNSQGGAGIWMSAGGPAFDGASVYFATGNDEPESVGSPVGCGNSMLQVNPYGGPGMAGTGFAQINKFTPTQASSWQGRDSDLASSRVIVVPGTNDVLVGGKAGNIYVVDRTSMVVPSPLQPFNVKGSLDQDYPEIAGGLAYWRNSIYTWGSNDVLRSFTLSGQQNPQAPNGGPDSNTAEEGIPISVSSQFDDIVTGLVWAVVPPFGSDPHNDYDKDKNPDAIHEFVTGALKAYSAYNLTWIQGASYNLNGNYIVKFTPPLVTNGKVYIVTVKPDAFGKPAGTQILVYGL